MTFFDATVRDKSIVSPGRLASRILPLRTFAPYLSAGIATHLSTLAILRVREEAYLLNPGDPGLLRQLDSIDASAASQRPRAGKTTIATRIDHVHYRSLRPQRRG